jgi:predicted amidohydrolase
MSHARFAVVQFAPELEPAANLERIRALAREARVGGATLILFPEYSSTFNPRLDEHVLERAQIVKGDFVTGIQQLARELGCAIVFGFVEVAPDSAKFANTVIAVGEQGDILAKYQKAHLYDAFGQRESDRVVAGKLADPPLFEHNGITVGIQTCYDLRFPEQTRWLMDAGATAILIPAEWVAGPNKVHHWKTLLAARAIENTLYVAAADHPGPVGIGHSAILDPLGVELASIDEGVGIRFADIDSSVVDAAREANPSIRSRRFSVEPKA